MTANILYQGWTKDPKKAESLVSQDYLDLIYGSVENLVKNKKQWYSGENQYVTKTLFVSNDDGLLCLHHVEEKRTAIVGFLDLFVDPAAWSLNMTWKKNIVDFLEFILARNGGMK